MTSNRNCNKCGHDLSNYYEPEGNCQLVFATQQGNITQCLCRCKDDN